MHTLKERALHPFRSAGHDDLRALRDVSFAVERGEFFGIVGRNGSGKSTLLKCLAGIYRTDRGQIYVDGRMSTFIELGVGFNMDLAAHDNVMLNATMLGLSQRETRARYDHIIDFAELREFADLKLKNYSSGMLVRLAFAVMIQVDADILLIDEVLAVGDAAFQQKCFDEFARIRRSGTTVLFVTHDMSAVQRFCDRAMLLEHGRSGRDRRARARRRALPAAELLARRPRRRGARGRRRRQRARRPQRQAHEGRARCAWATAGPRSSRRGSRTSTASAPTCCARGGRAASTPASAVNERLEDPLVGVNFQNSAGEHVWGANNLHGRARRASSSRRGAHLRAALHEPPGSRPLLGHPGRGQERRRPRVARPPPALRLGDGHGHQPPEGSSTCRSRSTSSARQPAPDTGARGGRVSDATVAAIEGLGPPIKGPTALGSDPRRLLRLTWALAVTDWRLRFFGSALGYLWSFVQPLMLFGVLYTVFSVLLNFSGDERFYPVALLLGIVLYSFLNEATGGAVRSLVNRENLVRKIEFPRLAVPMATVLTACFNLGLNLVPVTVFLSPAAGRRAGRGWRCRSSSPC